MDVLIISQDFPPDVGGTQTYASEIARILSATHRVRVIAPVVPGCDEFDKDQPFEIVRVRGGRNAFGFLSRKAIRRAVRVDGFRTAFCIQWTAAMAAVAVRRREPALRIHLAAHGRELLFRPYRRFGGVAYNRVRRNVLLSVDAVYPVSRYTATLVRAAGVPPDRIHTVRNGADPTIFRPLDGRAFRRKLRARSRPVLLVLCRLVRRKGVDVVICAMPDILTDNPDALLIVAGDGPERSALEKLAGRQGVADSVLFIGPVPYEDLPVCFSAADVFLLTPRHMPPDVEGFGLVYLEAGACELPVIGSRTGGISDAVQDGVTGLLVPPDDPAAVAAAVHLLLSEPSVARDFGRAGRAHVLDYANWNRVVETLLTHFGGGESGPA